MSEDASGIVEDHGFAGQAEGVGGLIVSGHAVDARSH